MTGLGSFTELVAKPRRTSKAKTEKPNSKAAPFEKRKGCGTPFNPSTIGTAE
jgi:hypothetical protein